MLMVYPYRIHLYSPELSVPIAISTQVGFSRHSLRQSSIVALIVSPKGLPVIVVLWTTLQDGQPDTNNGQPDTNKSQSLIRIRMVVCRVFETGVGDTYLGTYIWETVPRRALV